MGTPEPDGVTTQAVTVTRSRRPGASGLVLDEVERWTTLTLGVAQVAASYTNSTLAAAEGTESDSTDPDVADTLRTADVLAVAPGAVAALALRWQTTVFDLVATAESASAAVFTKLGAVKLTSPVARRLHSWLAALDEEFAEAQAERAELAATFLAAAGPRTLDELLSRIDLEAVLDRVDLDAVIDRVDLDSVVARVDVNDLMSGVIQEVQVTGLLRDGTGAIANGTVGVLRTQVGGVANRITGRK